ncbi:MAG: hypothetical protein IPO09_13795 [Anaeromyxobacter sp.]|nr:hypothetical protein [Anaeromyxobacter sp.]MBL0275259.1 hypothetical protein [Anaeromyxobacter sp.]
MTARAHPPARGPAAPLALAALVALAGCVEDPNAQRNQGEDCTSCHRPGGKAPRSEFSVAGTVFRNASGEPRETGAAAVRLVLADAAGARHELTTNPGGNFYSSRKVRFPVQARLELPAGGAARASPPGACSHGNCNACHSYLKPTGGARGRLVQPP